MVIWKLLWPVALYVSFHMTSPSPILQKRNPSVESFPEIVIFLNNLLMELHTDLMAFGDCTFLCPQPFSLGLRGTGLP